MKKLSITLAILFFVITSIYAGNIDFRNVSGINSSNIYSQKNTYKKYSFNAKSPKLKYSGIDSKTEAVLKISAGLLSNIESNEKGTYISTFSSGKISKSCNNVSTIFDLAFEMHYFMYEKFGIGGGLSVPLNVDIPSISASCVNPYISFKIKPFTNKEEVDNFYLLLNLGTFIPLYSDFTISLGYDIGAGYEYNSFIFELLYSYYKFDLFLNQYNYTGYYYSEHISEEDIDISRLKFVVGYKFAM